MGDILDKAMEVQAARVNDWLDAETVRLSHLCDRASEKGRKKENVVHGSDSPENGKHEIVIVDPRGGVFISDPKKPAGGHVLAHAATIRLMFRKGKGSREAPTRSGAPPV